MTDLASGWPVYKLGDVVENVNEYYDRSSTEPERYLAGSHIDEGSLLVRRWGLTSDETFPPTFNRRFRAGDVLFHSRNLRKLAQPAFDGITGEKLFVLRVIQPDLLLPSLLPFVLQSVHFGDYVNQMWAGSTNKFLNKTPLMRYELALPPLEEQRRIVEALRSADSMTEQLFDMAATIERALMSLAAVSFARNRWPERPLGELAVYASDGPFGSKLKTEHYSTIGARVIRLNNIDVNRFNDDDKAYVTMEYFTSSLRGFEVKAGDVVVAGLGDESIPAGRACVVPDELGPALNKADCFCLRPSELITARFLALFLNSPRGLSQSAAFSQGTTRLRLNLRNLKKMMLPVPPIDIQAKITDQFIILLDADELTNERRRQAAELRKSLLRRSLGGGSVF